MVQCVRPAEGHTYMSMLEQLEVLLQSPDVEDPSSPSCTRCLELMQDLISLYVLKVCRRESLLWLWVLNPTGQQSQPVEWDHASLWLRFSCKASVAAPLRGNTAPTADQSTGAMASSSELGSLLIPSLSAIRRQIRLSSLLAVQLRQLDLDSLAKEEAVPAKATTRKHGIAASAATDKCALLVSLRRPGPSQPGTARSCSAACVSIACTCGKVSARRLRPERGVLQAARLTGCCGGPTRERPQLELWRPTLRALGLSPPQTDALAEVRAVIPKRAAGVGGPGAVQPRDRPHELAAYNRGQCLLSHLNTLPAVVRRP